jgi:hypothetical protein
VDIISMSWTINEGVENERAIKELDDALEKAANKGIIMFCATRDLGHDATKDDKVYPRASNSKGIKSVGAALPSGDRWEYVKEQVDYLFPGVDIFPSTSSSGEEQKKNENGSSLATALAAGLAALILLCFVTQNEVFSSKEKKPKAMHKIFVALSPKENDYVMVGKLLEGPLETRRKFVMDVLKGKVDKDKEAITEMVRTCRVLAESK